VGALQPWHLIVILVIVLVVFGPGKLPQLGKAVGDSIRELKRATSEEPPPVPAAGVSPASRVCAECQAPMAIADRFCGACGAAQRTTTTSGASPLR
jgi:sec-independent protein translocase protein TatA